MQDSKALRRLVWACLTVAVALPVPRSLRAQVRQLTGTVDVAISEDFVRPAQLIYTLRGLDGRHYPLQLSRAQINNLGGPGRIAGRRVSVVGRVARAWSDPSVPGSPSLSEELVVDQLTPVGQSLVATPSLPGSLNYAVVGCKFPEIPTEPTTPAYWSRMLGGTSPGLDHYFREASNGTFRLSGSQATVWVTMPRSRTYYNNGSGGINQGLLVQDCLTVADPAVSFASFAGVILQFNEVLDFISWAWTRPMSWNVEGQFLPLRTVVLASWAATHQNVWAHEMLHSFGLWHSSGSTSYAYSSWWDVLSHGQYSANVFGQPGNVGMHTIAGYKALLGWLPASRIYDAAPGATQIALERSALPVSTTNYLLARISIPGTNEVYSVETRRFAGYDQPGSPQGMAGEGVIIHRMTSDGTWLPGANTDIAALVMDGDGNGNVNDAGAIWLPGETFTGAGGVSIRVDQALGTSAYLVTLSNSATYAVRVSATGAGAGRVISNPDGIDCYYPGDNAALQGTCTAGYHPGTSVALSQTASQNASFVRWTGDCSNLSCVVNMTGDRNVTAQFATQCTITVSAGTGGTAALTSGTDTGICGRSVTVTATPNTGYGFQRWSNGATGNPYTLILNSTQTLTATFDAQCSISVQANPTNSGTVTITNGAATGACGRSVSVAATAAAGWAFQNWTDGGVSHALTPQYTFVANSDRTLVANLVAQCTITASAGTGGNVALTSGTRTGACGRSVTVAATPDSGFTFHKWSDAVTANPYTLTVTGNLSLTAQFSAQCKVSVSASPSTSGTAQLTGGEATGACGRQVTVGATANAGHSFVKWTEDGVSQSTAAAYTFVANSGRTLVANFVGICTLTLIDGAGGTTTLKNGTMTGHCGRSLTLMATPHPGWAFTGWYENGVRLMETNPYLLLLNAHRTVEARFVPADLNDFVSRSTNELLGMRELSFLEQQWLDSEGNRNGRVDLGDLLALLDTYPALELAPHVLKQVSPIQLDTPVPGPTEVKP